MPQKKNIINNKDFIIFTNQMLRFYKACHLPENEAKQLIDRYQDYIRECIIATPELIARKIFQTENGFEIEFINNH